MPSSGRYRSQIFSAFSRQASRWSDRLAQSWRQAKLAATWGTQILLYPLYAAYQGARVVSAQIGQTVQQILPQLQSGAIARANAPIDELTDLDAPVDSPIVRSIAALAGLELFGLPPILPAADGAMVVAAVAPIVVVDLPGAIAPPQPIELETATVRVQGIASRLGDRRLVLTTSHNQLLDVLTPEQQIQLQQRIIWELASYRRLLRLRQETARPLPLPADSPNLLPPVRLLRRLVAWVQTSPIAIATNLFGEAALPPQLPPAQPAATERSIAPRFPWLEPLKERLNPSIPAALPSAAPASTSSWQPSSWQQRFSQIFHPPTAASASSSEPSALAIANSAKLVSTSPVSPQPDRWWRRKRLAAGVTEQPPIAAFGREATLPVKSDRNLVSTPRSLAAIDRAVLREPDRLEAEDSVGALAIDSESTVPAAAPSWIETEATLVGYVKHPLEQLLEWLDGGMLWLETRLSNFWRWLRGQ